eukprot:3941460-Rhodomonas_salina.3
MVRPYPRSVRLVWYYHTLGQYARMVPPTERCGLPGEVYYHTVSQYTMNTIILRVGAYRSAGTSP